MQADYAAGALSERTAGERGWGKGRGLQSDVSYVVDVRSQDEALGHYRPSQAATGHTEVGINIYSAWHVL